MGCGIWSHQFVARKAMGPEERIGDLGNRLRLSAGGEGAFGKGEGQRHRGSFRLGLRARLSSGLGHYITTVIIL